MIGGSILKVNDVTIHGILNTYGKGLQIKKLDDNSETPKKKTIAKNKAKKLNLTAKDLSVVNYKKDGTVNIDKDKKQSLIDFFQ